MSINEFVVITPDSCAMVADQLHPEVGGSASDSVDRIARYFDGMAVGAFYFNTISVELGMKQATATIAFNLVAAGDTVTIGNTVFTGSNTDNTTSTFLTNAVPSANADAAAAYTLAAAINANPATKNLVTATNVQGAWQLSLTVQQPGVIGNFVPVLISAHGIVSNGNPLVGNTILGSASTYALLAQTAITNSGNTVVNGNFATGGVIGGDTGWTFSTSPSTGIVNGVHHIADATYTSVYADSTTAAATLDSMIGAGSTDITSVDLGAKTYGPGKYHATTQTAWSASTNLTLNGAGVYIFSFDTTFIMPASASIILAGGATADNVYFKAGSAITFGASNTVSGNFLAGTAITTAAGTNLTGRLLVYGASGTAITIPSALVLGSPAPLVGLGGGADGSCLPKVILS